jgi:type I restriction-modification system DNA methylase subunit
MALFQKSVLNKYLNDLNREEVQKAFDLFKKYFHNAAIQTNIRDSKEEEYQEGFVRELFVNILGYTLKPQPDYNFVLEKKTEADATKSDGAILHNQNIIGVLELKDTSTIELDSIEKQVFGYKNKHRNCTYVITSNFEKIRFYINDAIDFEEFNLFQLSEERFAILYLCLHRQYIQKDVPLKMKLSSLTEEENVTKKLYADYSKFKKLLFSNIAEQNPQFDKLELFKKTQKLLDRFLFILFAEDRLLVPPNSVRVVLQDWEDLKVKYDEYKPLYDRFKKYFEYLNTGHQGKQYEIFAYNGGLFAKDEMLENIKIDDALLYQGCTQLSHYDFDSEIDVNILGHIFEHSLSEIEEVQAELEGKSVEKSKNKRKKEGIFYTPRYITKYIVENTLGELCKQKKEELKIIKQEFTPTKRKANKKQLLAKLDAYRDWLLQLTICDPACGSGAFLNQALDFLIAEHRTIDELKANLFGDALVLTDLDNDILEHNLFGVDINEDAVEIARLSLWLRTAKKGRKLCNLSNNIKCGNSIINDSSIAGKKAFNWKKEFEEVFEKDGFDVVIGNPPYGAKFNENEKEFFKKSFKTSTEGKIDSYRIFFEKAFALTRLNGLISYITPNTFLYNIQSTPLRRHILANLTITDAVELRKNIFEDAPDVVPVILVLLNQKNKEYSFRARVALHDKKYKDLNTDSWLIDQKISLSSLLSDPELKINLRSSIDFQLTKQKIEENPILDDFFYLKQGTKPYGVKENKVNELLSNIQIDKTWERAINGRNIGRYFIEKEDLFVQRSNQLHSVLSKKVVEGEKIYFQRMRKISLFPRVVSCYEKEEIHGLYTCSVIYKKSGEIDLKYLLCILNSYLINLWYKYSDTDIEIKLASVKKIPIPKISNEAQYPFIDLADVMLSKNKELQQAKQQLLQLLQNKYERVSISKKLEDWPLLSFTEFLKELNKQKIKLTLSEQADWMEYFEEGKTKVNAIQKIINDTDKEIDQMVYKLYDITEEEIKIIEAQKNI